MNKLGFWFNRYGFYAITTVFFTVVFAYVFNPQISMNGDNTNYLMFAKSILSGEGYSDLLLKPYQASSKFPPGFPLFLAFLMIFSKSVVFFKMVNGLLLLLAMFLFYKVIVQYQDKVRSTIAVIFVLANMWILFYATLLLSEMLFILCSAITVWLIHQVLNSEARLKHWILLILVLAFAFHVRTQGIALIGAAIFVLLFNKRWALVFKVGLGVIVLSAPWIIRNKVLGLDSNRYLDQILQVKHGHPEMGYVGIGEFLSRFFDTFLEICFKSIQSSMFPFLNTVHNIPILFHEVVIGVIILFTVTIGIIKTFGKLRGFFASYILLNVFIISSWSAPSDNRYLITVIPIFMICFIAGLQYLVKLLVAKHQKKVEYGIISILFLFSVYKLNGLSRFNDIALKLESHKGYLLSGEYIHEHFGNDVVICARKPSILYYFHEGQYTKYTFTEDKELLIKDLLETRVDYIIVDALTQYESTEKYLIPAINSYPDLFEEMTSYGTGNKITKVLKFNKDKAASLF